jgi:insulysin
MTANETKYVPVVPRKSAEDARDYRVITLDNKLKVTLISDSETDKASASMNVGVGHFSDPNEALGLAHFLEHS